MRCLSSLNHDCSSPMPNRRAHSFAFKQKAIQKAKASSNRRAARELGIDEKSLRMWRNQQKSIEECHQPQKRFRLDGGGRKPLLPEVENDVADWVLQEREAYHRVTRKGIAQQAKKLSLECATSQDFKASRGWVDKFLRRNNFCIRQKTTTGQRLPPELTDKVTLFVKFCHQQRLRYNLNASGIGNMDETAIWADMPSTTSVEQKGAKTVPILTTGHEKSRITVCLGALADGRKLQPLVILKGKRLPTELKNFRGVVIEMTSNGWMNGDTTLAWLTKCWGKLSFGKRMLVWDSFRSHITEEAKKATKQTNTVMSVIPGGCTKFCQPADVSWNAPFKAVYRELYEKWLHHPERANNTTAAGNPRAPSPFQMVTWVKDAWQRLAPEVIIRSFEACGITTSDPDKIHCTKEGGIAEGAREALLRGLDVDLDATDGDSSFNQDSDNTSSETDDENEIDI